MRLKSILFAAFATFAAITLCHAGSPQRPLNLKATAATDTDEVHPDSVFDVTLTLENPTAYVQSIRIPDCGWDRTWRSSNRHATWDPWDCDSNDQVTIQIQPHRSYVFPKPIRMFINGIDKERKLEFKMGFRPAAFGKIIWSNPIALDVTP
ncbi:MAG TPA: hypothetical protein VHY22_11515 [Chthoniobacteraceae bacterium]|jgi:hypothetical protein|nr:hypothetical protein [Chthoniobacteraceae bacterium]